METEQSAFSSMPNLGELLNNPQFREKLQAILSSDPAGTPVESKPIFASDQPSSMQAGNEMRDGIASVLNNPEMMAKLPQIMALLKPMTQAKTELIPSPEEARNRLMLSLKPFLSAGRQNAVDTMLRISQLGNVLKNLQN